MQVEMHDVKTQVSRTEDAKEGVRRIALDPRWHRTAIVTEVESILRAIALFGWLTPGDIETFDLDEVDGLVFEMGLGRNVRGDSTEDRARSLISAAQRRGRLTELIELCRRERPNGGF
mgnify:CR=1 FL=1